MRSLISKLHHMLWLFRLSAILVNHPFNWTRREAVSYGRGLYHLYQEEGFSPAEALDCDRQYWEA